MVVVGVGRLTVEFAWLGLRVGSPLALFCIHQMNQVNSRNNLSYDSTINIVKIIIIIIIICPIAIP